MSFLRPAVKYAIQTEPADCGFACVSAVLEKFSLSVPPHLLKEEFGSTLRGLSLTELRKILEAVGADVQAIKFRLDMIALARGTPLIALLTTGHFVVLVPRRARGEFDVFYPEAGWKTRSLARLGSSLGDIGLLVSRVDSSKVKARFTLEGDPVLRATWAVVFSALGAKVVLLALTSETVRLVFPLLAKYCIDALGIQAGGFLGTMGAAFLLIALLGSFSTLTSALASRKLSRRVSLELSTFLFDRLAQKPIEWFERHPSSYLFAQCNSMNALQTYYSDLLSRVVSASLLTCIALVALAWISPWLILPAIASVTLGSIVDVLTKKNVQSNSEQLLQAQRKCPQTPVLI